MRPAGGLANARILFCVAVTAAFVACGGTVAVPPTVTPDEWQRGMAPRPTLGVGETGRDLFSGPGACSACHTIAGISQGVLGPDLTNIGSVAGERIPGYTAEEYIRESIVDPCAYDGFHVPGLPSCDLMDPARTGIILSDDDVDALVVFLLEQK